jgi:hypothetical protein
MSEYKYCLNMSFGTHLNSHTVAFLSYKDCREGSQIENQNQKHPIHSYSLQYKPLYEMCNTYLSNGYSVIYGAESIPNKPAEEKVFENIINVNSEVENYLSKGFLTVVNRDSIYEECGTDHKSIVNFWNSNVNRIQKKLDGKTKGTMMFSEPDSYFKHDKHHIFMMFEQEMGKTFHTKSGMICWYKEEWLNSLSLASLIKVLITHKYVVYDDWKNKAWTENEIINLISKGIDKSLGEGSATLLFQAMRTIHKLNQDVVISRPVVFEATLKRLVGNDQQVSVMDSISKEIIERIMFCNGFL